MSTASTSQAVTRAARAAANPFTRKNKRTAQANPRRVLNSLISTYHLAPTFLPLESAKHDAYITPVLALSSQIHYARPRPTALRDLSTANRLLDVERVSFDQSKTMFDLRLDLPSNHNSTHAGYLSSSPVTATKMEDSAMQAFVTGEEPPLYQRIRVALDTLHGTSSGGLAGLETVKEKREQAQEWRKGMQAARDAAEKQEKQLDRELEDFDAAFGEAER